MNKMNEMFENFNDAIKENVEKAIGPLTKRLDKNSRRMDRLEEAQRRNMEEVRYKLDKLSGTRDEIEPVTDEQKAPSYAGAAALPAAACKVAVPAKSDNWYWDARRCIRFNPIQGDTQEQMLAGLDDFVINKLKIPTGVMNKDDVTYVRRVKSSRRSKIKDELLVCFATVEARDLVQSYARNLGEWIDPNGQPLAGMRMQIPERLLGDQKTFEQYGHNMWKKHGKQFKRHIKLDDSSLTLYMDAFIPKIKKWIRIEIDVAREDNSKRKARMETVTDKNLLSTCVEEDEVEEMDGE